MFFYYLCLRRILLFVVFQDLMLRLDFQMEQNLLIQFYLLAVVVVVFSIWNCEINLSIRLIVLCQFELVHLSFETFFKYQPLFLLWSHFSAHTKRKKGRKNGKKWTTKIVYCIWHVNAIGLTRTDVYLVKKTKRHNIYTKELYVVRRFICLGAHLFVDLDKNKTMKKKMKTQEKTLYFAYIDVWMYERVQHQTIGKQQQLENKNGRITEPLELLNRSKVLETAFIYCHFTF